ncbi:MAG: hypothetical protein ACKOBG_01060 [Actinomycetota bacterium]
MSGERPEGEAVDHLWAAAHEFLRAVRKLVDAADELVEQQRSGTSPAAAEPRLRRIDLDDE